MPRTFYQVDAFTNQPFAGNPAAVFVLDDPVDDRWMQLVAREMNLAETAFLRRRSDGQQFDLRWFTLASAHVLWQTNAVDRTKSITFHTRSGALGAARDGDWIELDFPATPPKPTDQPFDKILGIRCVASLRTKFDGFAEVESAEALRSLRPDFGAIKTIGGRGLIVTARSDRPEFDFLSRFFAPQVNVDEDPVTGSSHCALGPYWASKLGKTDLMASQASPRGGVVRVRGRGGRVLLGGQAVTVFRGELHD
jgi:predicted PhzF superfamily epimerase YddE/YHI9